MKVVPCCGFLFAINPAVSRFRDSSLSIHELSCNIPNYFSAAMYIHTSNPLHAKNEDADEESKNTNVDSDVPSMNPRLLLTDLLAVAIACQLMGLIDVLNDPVFWTNGGWLQPILVPESLPTLVQRFSINSCVLICVAVVFPTSLSNSFRTTLLQSLSMFSIVRIGLGLILLASHADTTGPDALNVIVESIRECYFVSVATTTGRFALNKLQERF